MHANRRALTYSSLVVAIAVLLSVALLQLTQTTAQSAAPAKPVAQPLPEYTLTITKTVEGGAPSTDWEYTVEGTGILSTVTVPAVGGSASISVPLGTYSITEVIKDGYWLKSAFCPPPVPQAPTAASNAPQPVFAYVEGEDVTCGFENSKLASLTVVKDAIPDSTQPFTFTVYMGQSLTNFQLVDDGTGVSNTITFTDGMAGSYYSIYEDIFSGLQAGWVPIGAECVDATGALTGSISPDFSSAFLGITAGAHYTCTFTNGAPRIELTKTVGTAPGVCATTDDITVFPGTQVEYCYEVKNTGGLTLTMHTLDDDQQGNIFTDWSYDLAPDDTVNNLQASYPVTDVLAVTTQNVATWTALVTYSLAIDSPVSLPEDVVASAALDEVIRLPGVMTLTVDATDPATVTVVEPGKIIVKKVTNPLGSSQPFSFTIDSQVALQFALKDGEQYTTPDLWPGTYHVTETPVPGWTLISATCQDDAGKSYPPGNIDLPAGVTVTCTFENRQQGKIIVDKVTDPAGMTQPFDFTLTGPGVNQQFSLTDGDPPRDSGYLDPGGYAVTETVPAGWVSTGATCTDGTSTIPPDGIDLSAGMVVTCTFNNQQQGKIIVDKATDPAGSAQSFDFTLTGPGVNQQFSLTDGSAPHDSGFLTAGSYSVAETPVDGWTLDSVTCTDGEQTFPPDDINVLPGVTVTCTFNNKQEPTALDDDDLPPQQHIYLPQISQ